MAAAAAAPASAFRWPTPPQPCSVDDALGPLSLSNWVLPGMLCVGGYPSAMSNEKAMQYAHAIVDSGLDTIVNLMQSNELSRFREYAGLMTQIANRPLHFLSYPIGDGSCPKDADSFLALVDDLLQRLQSGGKLYIHCWGGHGRTGTVLSVLLGAMYPARSADECLALCQELHTARAYNGTHRSPEESQKGFVRSAIERVRQIQAGTESWPPAALQGWTVANLPFTDYSPSESNANDSSNSNSKQTKRQRIQAGLPPTTPPRAGGGSGIIVVDSFGTASTTQAMSSVPSTPLMSPAVRRISAEGLKLARENSNGNANSTLLPRQMIAIDNEHAASSSSAAASSLPPPFTLLTMNTLADSLCDTKSFPHTVPAALEWSKRCELILDEITAANRSSLHAPAPEIICLQEVDHYSDFFSPRLKDLGYGAGFFLGKADKTATSGDGVAIFVRPDAFQVRRIQRLSMPGMNQVALIAQLAPVGESKEAARRLYVVTTHLKAKDGFEIVRLKQVQIILHAVESFIARFHETSLSESTPVEAPIDISLLSNPPHASLGADFVLPSTAALIFAGDFNDTPDSAMFSFIAQGSSAIDTSHVGVKKHATAAAPSAAVESAAMTDDGPPPPAAAARAAASQSVLGLLSSGATAVPSTAASSSASSAASSSSSSAAAVSSSASSVCPVRHSLWLHSLYNRFFDPAHPANHSGDLYTTAKRRSILVQRCIDYIWFSSATIRPKQLLSIPKVREEIPQFLPEPRYPSDHLAIAGRFEWSTL